MGQRTVDATDTTAEGLAALTRQIVTGSIRGELDSGFVRSLAKCIAKEYDLMLRCGRTDGEHASEVVAAMDMLRAITDSNDGRLLSGALTRLRLADADELEAMRET